MTREKSFFPASSSTVNSENIAFTQQQVGLIAHFEFIASVGAENDVVARLHRQGDLLAAALDVPFTHGDHITTLRFIRCGIRKHNPASGFCFR
jgi:hypothetical protein